jgi:hypothetical protein
MDSKHWLSSVHSSAWFLGAQETLPSSRTSISGRTRRGLSSISHCLGFAELDAVGYAYGDPQVR